MASGSKVVIWAAVLGNMAIAIAKFVAAALTGSSAMLSEGIHSLVDTGNGGLLLLGVRLSKRPPDEAHPFGSGKELYFWALVVAVSIFGIGGGMSLYEGVVHLSHPGDGGDPLVNYVVLGIAFVFETGSWIVAMREFRRGQRAGESAWKTLRRSKDPALFTVLLEDTAALVGLLIAFVGVLLNDITGNPAFEAFASLGIGLLLILVAVVLAWETKELLVGEGADPEQVASIRSILSADQDVVGVAKVLTLHFGPEDILLVAEIHFRKGLLTGELAGAIDRIENAVRAKHPRVKRIFLEAKALVKKDGPTKPP